MWDAPGRCDQLLELSGASVTYLEVAPREASFFSGVPGNMMASAGPQGAVAGLGVMLGGMALESSGKSCGGAFSITPVDRDQALPRLAELRSSH
jgi:Ser/Thr protein kinase RdoA (MazF antagonist)